eukprot:TRINITY_DN2317_c0_g1_i2.p1 TRINITY_DN2317_c0_g1~~TRINITY_DN2317_c0_g1_i2.p1  ORF type:complete len:1133 (+),score=361.12 TRINITY_DN2317_c0_g1_i2:259-3399(+)
MDNVLAQTGDNILYGVVRVLHLKNHLSELDAKLLEERTANKRIVADYSLLGSKLILQSFLDYLKEHGPDRFSELINTTGMRLISTAHPNETERNTNLKHYNSILDRYIEWTKDYDSLNTLPKSASEYRIRREQLNQIRRTIKAEIEGVWQSDQMRGSQIPVESEALRILERYKIIFRAYPPFIKFLKFLAKEAFFLYQASKYFESNQQWREKFLENFQLTQRSREEKLKAIKRTFVELNIQLEPPRIVRNPISFGTWKGGDRDGNPFVVASFTNRCFIEQKQFVLQEYVTMASNLIDKLTPSTKNIAASPELLKSLERDYKHFPYVQNVKPHEPYRSKIRYIQIRLQNSLDRVNEVIKGAGTTTRPLLSQTLPGPSGYNTPDQLRDDINVLYTALSNNAGKSQARSTVQDLQILVDTFGLSMTSIDFRQTSDKNALAVAEYLKVVELTEYSEFRKQPENERQKILLELLLRDIEIQPWIIPQLSGTSRDTFETMLIFADAHESGDQKSIGKFIISMCQCVSDILVVLFLMKLVGMLKTKDGKISECPFDVTGLFETIADLKQAPIIVKNLLSISLIRNYLLQHRNGRMTVMMGYSDSVRDGSPLASDSQVIKCALTLKKVETEMNKGLDVSQHIHLSYYRGRGDTIPRGYGGSITKAIASQMVVTDEEDHTEQNRYLRCYSSFSSALDHFHKVFSAHLTVQLNTVTSHVNRYQRTFDFFGHISNLKWLELVSPENGGNGDIYFSILRRFGILKHLPKSHFASRPVARDGVTYNIDSIRAIPFTMDLAQLREFTTGYYGTGTAFEQGTKILGNFAESSIQVVRYFLQDSSDAEISQFHSQVLDQGNQSAFASLVRSAFKIGSKSDLEDLVKKARSTEANAFLNRIFSFYNSKAEAISEISLLLTDVQSRGGDPITTLQEMYNNYPPFRYSIENKEAALLIRDRRIVQDYTRDATPEQQRVLAETQVEAELASLWILKINKQADLKSKTLATNFHSLELDLLHRIQRKFLDDHFAKQKNPNEAAELRKLDTYIQMTILAISEALGFAG